MMVTSIQNELRFESISLLVTSDERKHAQLRQNCCTKRRRVPGRAWKKQELTSSPRSFKRKTAINDNDANYLDAILTHIYVPYAKKTHWSNKHRPWTKRRYQHTTLTRAIERGHSECIEVVLESIFHGFVYPTIVDHVCRTGRTALWYACRKGDLDLVRQLIEHSHAHIAKCGVLIVAAQNGHTNIVEYLLNKGCDPNRPAKNYNETALHAASRRNHLVIVNLLLKHGADPTILDYKERTALEYAIHKKHIEVAKALIYHQNEHFDKNHFGFTPLMVAAYFNKTPIVDIFFEILPRQQALEELALLACKYTIDGYASRRDQAYCYFEKFLMLHLITIVTYLIESKKVNDNELRIFYGLIRRTLRQNVTETTSYSLFNRFINDIKHGEDYNAVPSIG
ncbi:unnamed protein product [Rotaria sordida]|uniref:Uncharacterized protein n=1 Tax=Rotaria sordida TaxID=392033 RepID=A0A813XS67_9BILA|nr:unnamed protein product [Rotaria sordida]